MSKMGSGWGWIAGAGLLVLAAIAVMVARVDDGGFPVSVADATSKDAPASARLPSASRATGGDGRPVRLPTVAGDLPPVGTPFRLAIDTLQRRARAGEPAAMCRLAAEHTECKRIRDMLDATSRMLDLEEARLIRDKDADARARRLAQTAERSDELIETSRHCDGVPEIPDRELVHQWRAAAQAGSLPALEYYALGQAFPMDKMLSLLPELALYRAEAEAMAIRASAAGSMRATMLLGMAYMPAELRTRGFTPLLMQAVDPDAVESMALLRYAEANASDQGTNNHFAQVFAKQLSRLEAEMTPEERDAARRRRTELEYSLGSQAEAAYEEPAGREALVEACAAAAVSSRP